MIKAYKGISITEYGFAAVLIAVACIGAVFLMGEQVDASLRSLMGSVERHGVAAETEEQNANAPVTGIQTSSEHAAGASSLPTATADFLLNEASMASVIETSGANGQTELLANQIQQIAQEQLAAGKMTQEQAATLTALSNEGHRIAKLEALLENAMTSAKTADDYANTKIVFEGKTYTAMELSDTLGWQDGKWGMDTTNLLGNVSQAGSGIQGFLKTYEKAVQQGALKDPTTKGVIDNLSSQITLTGEFMSNLSSDVAGKGQKPPKRTDMNRQLAQWTAEYPEPLPGEGAVATYTNNRAAAICVIGNGKEKNNKHCSEAR